VGGAVKNVIAIAAGMCEGLGLGTNAMAALVTRGCNEMQRLALSLGAMPTTLTGEYMICRKTVCHSFGGRIIPAWVFKAAPHKVENIESVSMMQAYLYLILDSLHMISGILCVSPCG
jgi:hypothetical protein